MDETFGAPQLDPNAAIGDGAPADAGFGMGDPIDPITPENTSEAWHADTMSQMPSIADLIADADPALPNTTVPDLALPETTVPDLGAPAEPTAPAPAGPILTDPLEEAATPTPDPLIPDDTAPDADQAPGDGVYGSPTAWTADWFWQEVDGYCGPSAAAQLVSECTGLDISNPQQLVDRALELGLFKDGDPTQGMTMKSLETLLEDQNVPCHSEYSSLDDLKGKLAGGYGVIAMIDSGEVWYPDQELGEDDAPDHVVVVAGIDEARGVVILSDPGDPNGNQSEVPIAQFEDAWADSDKQMLVSDDVDPDLVDPSAPDADQAAALQPKPWALLDLIGLS
jgi:hypothetical protein